MEEQAGKRESHLVVDALHASRGMGRMNMYLFVVAVKQFGLFHKIWKESLFRGRDSWREGERLPLVHQKASLCQEHCGEESQSSVECQ